MLILIYTYYDNFSVDKYVKLRCRVCQYHRSVAIRSGTTPAPVINSFRRPLVALTGRVVIRLHEIGIRYRFFVLFHGLPHGGGRWRIKVNRVTTRLSCVVDGQ